MHQVSNNTVDKIDDQVLDQALRWAVTIKSGKVNQLAQQQLQTWLNQQPENRVAWQQIQVIEQEFVTVKQAQAGYALKKPKLHKKSSLALSSSFCLCILASAYYWGVLDLNYWRADYSTAKGEHKSMELTGGAKLILNSNTTIVVDYVNSRPNIELLEGSIFIDSAHAPTIQKPSVLTKRGSFTPTGTQFVVNNSVNETRLQVLEGAVTIKTDNMLEQVVANQGWILAKGVALPMNSSHMTIKPAGWTRFVIEADNAKLSDVIDKLRAYHSGFLSYSKAAGNLKISGTFQLNNSKNALLAIKASLPVEINNATKWFTRIKLAKK